jgi:hypothetical protein
MEEGEQDVQVLDSAFGEAAPAVAHPPAPEPPPFPLSRPEEPLAGSLLVDEPEAASQFPEPPPYPTSADDLLLPPGEDGFEEAVQAPEDLPADLAASRSSDLSADLDGPLPPTRTVSVPVLDLDELHAGRVRPAAPEDVRKFIAWEVSAEASSSIEEALSAAYDRAQRDFEAAPEEHFDDASQLAAGVLPEPVAPPQARKVWSLTEARHRLSVAPGRDEILAVALEFALKSFDFAAALAVRSGTAFGWQAMHTDGHEDLAIHQVALPLDAPSVLRTVLRARGRYLGPLPDDAQTQKLLRDLDREAPRAALIYPVFVRERPVAFFYADRGHRHVAAPKVAEFLLFAQELSTAFERAILRQKGGPSAPVKVEAVAPLLTSSVPVAPAAPVAPAPEPAPLVTLPRAVTPPRATPPLQARPTTPALGTPDPARQPTQPNAMVRVTPPRPVRAAEPVVQPPEPSRTPTEIDVDIEESPAEFTPSKPIAALIDDLLQPDRKRRAAAQRELERAPSLAAPALAARFPGPTPFRRGLVGDLPEPDEMGPIAGALARLKGAAVLPLARLLVEGDPDARFFAVLLAGWLVAPELLPGLRRCLFDPVNEVAAAARAAAVPFRKLAGFEDSIARPLRDELASPAAERVSRAALALGRVHDVQSIPLLIPLTGHAEDRVAMDASVALTELTLQTLGDSPRRWAQWWESNRRHPRERWLVDGLSHPDLPIRLTAIAELVDEANDTFGYAADGPRGDRARAIERWDQWLRHREARAR